MKKLLWLTISLFSHQLLGTTMIDLAEKNHLFDYLRDLRTQADNLLDTLENVRQDQIGNYQRRHMHKHAQEKEGELGYEYELLSDELDRRFRIIDTLIVLKGTSLDLLGSSDATKQALIDQARNQASILLEGFIRDLKAFYLKGNSTLDFIGY